MRIGFRVPVACVALGVLLFGSGGCAPPIAKGSTDNNASTFLSSVASSSASGAYGNSGNGYNSGQWSCPSSPNVTPTGYDNFTESEIFTVCQSTVTPGQLMISGTTGNSGLCVYPMQSSQGSVTLVAQPQCFSVGNSSATLTFNSQSINYVIIVDINFSNQMSSCLSSAATCPNHSEGFVE